MNTKDEGSLRAALTCALQNWAGVDDVEVAVPGQGTSRIDQVEGVEGGFWVDARVFVNDEQALTLLGREPEDMPGESRRVPPSRYSPRPTVPLFASGDPHLSEKAEEMFGGGRRACGKLVHGNWALDFFRPGEAPCTRPLGHEGPHDADWTPEKDGETVRQEAQDRLRRNKAEDERVEALMPKWRQPMLPAGTWQHSVLWLLSMLEDHVDERRHDLDEDFRELRRAVQGSAPTVVDRQAITALADGVNQLAMLLEEIEYARITGLRGNVSVFQAKQARLRKVREHVAGLIEP